MVVTMINGIPWWYFHKLAGRSKAAGWTAWTPAAHRRAHRARAHHRQRRLPRGRARGAGGRQAHRGQPLHARRARRQPQPAHRGAGAGHDACRLQGAGGTDIRGEIWVKLWGNLSFNPISALTHATLEDICRFPPTRTLVAQMMREAQAVAERLGVEFKISLDQRIAGAEAVGAHKTSMLQDVEHGRALELEALVGAVVELGRITGMPTPTIDAVYAIASLLARTLAGQGGKLAMQPAG
jgi:2-dehydropantoate 2-reductase